MIQPDGAHIVLLRKEQQGLDGIVGRYHRLKDSIQNFDRLGHGRGRHGFVKGGVAMGDHLQRVGHIKPLRRAGVVVAVKAGRQIAHLQIALTVIIFIAPKQEVVVKHMGQPPDCFIILLVVVDGGVFIDNCGAGTVIFAHR